jgi:hypothetical protein
MQLNDDNEQLIETLFRNGTLTVIGIVLSFSLGFLTQWASNPIPWQLLDLPTIVLISAGIIWQMVALIGLLQPASLKKQVFDKANRRFVIGLISTSAGVVLAVVVDFIELLIVKAG